VEYGYLLGRLNNESLWAQGFAEDIAIIINGKFLSTVCERMQKALFIVQTWCQEVRRPVNTDKTSMVLFTNNRKLMLFKKPNREPAFYFNCCSGGHTDVASSWYLY
jgi:hypothetical protein